MSRPALLDKLFQAGKTLLKPALIPVDNTTIKTVNNQLAVQKATATTIGGVKISGEDGLVMKSDGSAAVDFDAMPTDKFETMLKSIRVPIWLAANKAFYVNGSTGSDTLDSGRVESTSKPFKTIQAAVNYVCDNYNISRYDVTIYCADVVTTEQLVLPTYNATDGHITITRWSVSESDYGVTIDYKPTGSSFAVDCTGGTWYLNYFNISNSNENYTNGSSHWGGVTTSGLTSKLYLNNNIRININIVKESSFAGAHAILCSSGSMIVNSAIEINGQLNEGLNIRLNAMTVDPVAKLQYANGEINLKISGKFTRILFCSGNFSVNGVFRDDIDTTGITEAEYKYYINNGGACNTGGKGPDYFGTIGEGYVDESTYSWYK